MVKRLFDLFSAVLGLLLFLPLFFIIAVWIKLDSRGPVFFCQTRVGRHGDLFKIIKFRTMVSNAESQGLKLTTSNDNRITGSGGFLRNYKLDEIPQLINVLKGEMSLVGPRPEVPEYVACYTQTQKDIILSVLPGMTDDASIRFVDENRQLAESVDPHQEYIENILPVKLSLYEDYVRERSFFGDLWILFKTFKEVVKSH